ncbi:MAG: helix-turn-helix transcriptional regulator [Dechloromonas sp.]|nr:helix-turn-helix transcriptional regulator [Dechloromonas sp.]
MTEIKKARKLKGLTVYDLAKSVGVTPGSISRIERGLVGISPAKAKKMAEALGLSVEQVLFPEEKAA